MDREQSERYSQDEVADIIDLATRLERGEAGGLSEVQLRQVAQELGISGDSLDEALARRRREAEGRAAATEATNAKRQERVAGRSRQWQGFKGHLASYLGVIGGLAVIDLASGNGLDWFFYPGAAWGIGLAIHGLSVAFGVGDGEGTG